MALPDLGYAMIMNGMEKCFQVLVNCEIKIASTDLNGWQVVFWINLDKRYIGSLITKQTKKEILEIIKSGGSTIVGRVNTEDTFRDQKGRTVVPFYGKIVK